MKKVFERFCQGLKEVSLPISSMRPSQGGPIMEMGLNQRLPEKLKGRGSAPRKWG